MTNDALRIGSMGGRRPHHHIVHWFLVALWAALLPGVSQAEGRTLMVVVTDLAGRGVANIRVIIRDEHGVVDLARAGTDRSGVARITGVSATTVRVAVAGALVDGTWLVQRGQDARGIWLQLDAAETRLDLRVEPGGAVIPDPATMISPDSVPGVIPHIAERATPVGVPRQQAAAAGGARSISGSDTAPIPLVEIALLAAGALLCLAAIGWLPWRRRCN